MDFHLQKQKVDVMYTISMWAVVQHAEAFAIYVHAENID